jgi:hypothetical protein
MKERRGIGQSSKPFRITALHFLSEVESAEVGRYRNSDRLFSHGEEGDE